MEVIWPSTVERLRSLRARQAAGAATDHPALGAALTGVLVHREGVTPADAAALLGHTVEVLATYLPHSGTSGILSAAQALGR